MKCGRKDFSPQKPLGTATNKQSLAHKRFQKVIEYAFVGMSSRGEDHLGITLNDVGDRTLIIIHSPLPPPPELCEDEIYQKSNSDTFVCDREQTIANG